MGKAVDEDPVTSQPTDGAERAETTTTAESTAAEPARQRGDAPDDVEKKKPTE